LSPGKCRGLVGFDLDGTLIRGRTVCEILAEPLGKTVEMSAIEVITQEEEMARSRELMAEWYKSCDRSELIKHLETVEFAPGAHVAIEQLQSKGIEVTIISLTWNFAVAWFAEQFNIRYYIGTGLDDNSVVEHIWGRHKGLWLTSWANQLNIPINRIAAVGDTHNDYHLLKAANLRYYVGVNAPPDIPPIIHIPNADIREISQYILETWLD